MNRGRRNISARGREAKRNFGYTPLERVITMEKLKKNLGFTGCGNGIEVFGSTEKIYSKTSTF